MKTNPFLPIASSPTNYEAPLCSGIFQHNPNYPKTLLRAKVPKNDYVLVLNCPGRCSALPPEHVSRRISLLSRKKEKEERAKGTESTSENESETAPHGRGQTIDAEKTRRTSAAREEDAPGKAERL